jgi:hypothetical protein
MMVVMMMVVMMVMTAIIITIITICVYTYADDDNGYDGDHHYVYIKDTHIYIYICIVQW